MSTIIALIGAADHPDIVRALIAEHEYQIGKGSVVSDSILIVRACRKHGLPLPAPKIVKGLDDAATKANYTRCVQGTNKPACSLEEAQVASRLVSIAYVGPGALRDRDGSYARHAHAARTTPVRPVVPTVDPVAELEREIERRKAVGTAPAIIAVMEKRLAKLKEDHGPK